MVITGQLRRFVVVGLLNTAAYLAGYLLLRLVLPYLLAHVVAYAISMVGAFFLHCRITYRAQPTVGKFLRFPLTNAAGFTATTLVLWLLVDVAGAGERLAPLLAAAAAVPVSFLVSRAILTTAPRDRRRDPAVSTGSGAAG